MDDSPSKTRRKATFREVGPSISKDELIRRLKTAAQGFTSIDQGEKTTEFDSFTASIASPFIFYHKDKDVKSYAACCFADILRIYAPEPPYNEDQLKDIFRLIIKQLKGLENVSGPTYKRNFYILESLALVKTFNVCMELEAQDIMQELFQLFFSIISDQHNIRVKNFMLDIMVPLIQECDALPQETLETILIHLVSPSKTKKPHSYQLACDLLERCSSSMEPYIQLFFNNGLVLGGDVHKALEGHLYDLMYELFKVNQSVLLSVLPQLEFKLKGNEEPERLEAVKLLCRMFGSENSTLAESNKQLWNCYLGRFCDISPDIRIECIHMAKSFLLSHIPFLRSDVTEQLINRLLDTEEKVRLEALLTCFEAAMENFEIINVKLIENIKERMRDKKWFIRKEAITCIGKLYKKLNGSAKSRHLLKDIYWVPSKILHQYYINNMEDRLCIERVVHGCLIPVTLNVEDRMHRLFHLYTSLDEMATILFNNMLQLRAKINEDFNELLTAIKDEEMDDKEKVIHRLNILIARALPDPVKTQDHLKKLSVLFSDNTLYKLFQDSTNLKQECPKIIKCVSEIVKKLSSKNVNLETVKALLDRACPMLVDKTSFIHFLKKIQKYFEGFGDDEDEDLTESELMEKGKKALKLVEVLAKVRPVIFQSKQTYEILLVFLKQKDRDVVEQTLHCLKFVLSGIEEVDKSLCACFKPVLNELVVTGSCKQSKYAIRCIHVMMKDSPVFMERLFSTLVKNLTEDETYYHLQTTMSALGEMALLVPTIFDTKHKQIIRDFVVKKVLVVDKEKTSKAKEPEDEWGPESNVSEEIRMKVQAIKLLMKWLVGLENNQHDNAMPVLRLLCSLLNNDGDLCGEKNVSAVNRSRLRLAASSALLKLAQQVKYIDAITLEQFHQVALVMQDSCFEVRELFTVKLHKGLETLRLPPDYLAIYALVAVDPSKERRNKIKQMIVKNAQTRRDYCKQHSSIASKPYAVLPEYSLPYLVHLLAHHPDYDHQSNDSLLECKEYLWYFLEPLLGAKAENYSFLKKLLENIKRTKDRLDPENTNTNERLYAVCDIAIACIMQKTHTFTLKDFPGNLVLPKKLFVAEKNASNNTKSYLPKNFVFSPKKQKNIVDTKTANKKSVKRMKRSANESDDFDSEDDIPLAATPAKKPRSETNKNSSSKKNPSVTKNKNSKVVSSPVKAARRNLNASPKKSPAKGSKASPKKRAVASKENKSPNKSSSRKQSPKKKDVSPKKTASPKKNATTSKSKQTKIDSFVNGHKSDSENENDSDVEMIEEEEEKEEETSEKYTAINDEKPARKSATPSPKKRGSPTKATKGKKVVNDKKPTPKLKIRRKLRGRR